MVQDIASLTLANAIGGLVTRQQVTANNIANLETPGFTASSVQFEQALASAVAAGDPTNAAPSVSPTTDAPGINGNNVNLEDELITATKTGLQQQLLTGAITSRFGWVSIAAKA